MKFFTWVYLAVTLLLVAASVYVIFNPTGRGLFPDKSKDPAHITRIEEASLDSAVVASPPKPETIINKDAID